MKRFYTLVSTRALPEGFGICLDGKPVKTPSGRVLCAPSEALAQAIVQEWAAQEGQILPDTMPLTQMLNTQIDQVQDQRAVMSAAILKYLDTDLLCYRCGTDPQNAPLAQRQAQAWNPWLDWFAQRFGVALETTTGLFALSQPPAAHAAVKAFVEGLDAGRFTILQILTPVSGSLVLGLAFVEGGMTPEEVFAATHVEEQFKAALYNEDFYGPDPAQAKKDTAVMRDLQAAGVYLGFC